MTVMTVMTVMTMCDDDDGSLSPTQEQEKEMPKICRGVTTGPTKECLFGREDEMRSV